MQSIDEAKIYKRKLSLLGDCFKTVVRKVLRTCSWCRSRVLSVSTDDLFASLGIGHEWTLGKHDIPSARANHRLRNRMQPNFMSWTIVLNNRPSSSPSCEVNMKICYCSSPLWNLLWRKPISTHASTNANGLRPVKTIVISVWKRNECAAKSMISIALKAWCIRKSKSKSRV